MCLWRGALTPKRTVGDKQCVYAKIGWKSLWWTESIRRQFSGSHNVFSPSFFALSFTMGRHRKNFHLYANPQNCNVLVLSHASKQNALHHFHSSHMCDNRCSQVIRMKLVFVRSWHGVFVVDHNCSINVLHGILSLFFRFFSLLLPLPFAYVSNFALWKRV